MSKTIFSLECGRARTRTARPWLAALVPCHLERGRQRSRPCARPPNEAPQADGPSGGLQQTRREQPLTNARKLVDLFRVLDFR